MAAGRALRRWGANEADLARVLPGDGLVTPSNYDVTYAVTVAAPPGDIWPWLMQLGDGRGGLYSYDWLDRAFGFLHGPSATDLLPGYDDLAPGDAIPLGRGASFPVLEVDHERALLLGDPERGWTWCFALADLGEGRTRLISRNHGRMPWLVKAWLAPAVLVMTRRMLLNLRGRAEHLAAERAAAVEEAELIAMGLEAV
ncbi:MAG: SRPBCC family protein [Dehalococcoidia bacterium]|nr:SRPBCC family protein [Dehalococcoidia bacterium]